MSPHKFQVGEFVETPDNRRQVVLWIAFIRKHLSTDVPTRYFGLRCYNIQYVEVLFVYVLNGFQLGPTLFGVKVVAMREGF